jgi:hypothetical protein
MLTTQPIPGGLREGAAVEHLIGQRPRADQMEAVWGAGVGQDVHPVGLPRAAASDLEVANPGSGHPRQ